MTDLAPEPDRGVTITCPPGRLIRSRLAQLGASAVVLGLAVPAGQLATGQPPQGRNIVIMALADVFLFVFIVVVIDGLRLLAAWDRPPEVSLDSDGIVLAAWDRDAAFVPWSAVSSVALRGRWPRWLDVEVTDPAAVELVDRGGGRPRRRWRRPYRLTMEAGLLRGGPDRAMASVHRYRPM